MVGHVVRTGIVGAGNIASRHVDAIRATKGVALSAICDVSASAAQALAGATGAQAFTSLDELIASGACDAIHILTPPPLHRKLAVQAFQAGLHCYIEKPVALSSVETRDITEAADKADRVLGVGHNFMGSPKYQRLQDLCKTGQLGRIAEADIRWNLPLAPLRSGPFGLWLLRSRENLLLELGPHLFGFANDLFGVPDIEHVSLGKPIEIPGAGGVRPQSWRIMARAGHVDLNLSLSLVETTEDRSVTVRGSSGMAQFDYANDTLVRCSENSSDVIVNGLRRQGGLSWQHLREGATNASRQLFSLNRKSPYDISFQGALGAFYDAIRSGTSIDRRFSGASAVSVMQAIDDVLAMLPPDKQGAAPKRERDPKPSVLVIGGTGFIGRALTRALVERGRDVRVLSRGRTGPFADLPKQVEIMSASLTNPEDLDRAMHGIDAVYHLGKSLDSTWEDCLKNDVGVTVAIAEAALRAGVKAFVYTGTIASYDMSDPNTVITEQTGFSDDMTDRNLYARSKAESERRLLDMQHQQNLPLTIARPGIVVGEGGPLQHWGIGRWHGAGAVRIWNHGRNVLPFVLIDDVADGLVRMIETEGAIGQNYNLTGEPMFSARGYFDAINEHLGARISVDAGNPYVYYMASSLKYLLKRHVLRKHNTPYTSLKDWKSRAHFSRFDNQKAKRELGWQPEISSEKFVAKSMDSVSLFGF